MQILGIIILVIAFAVASAIVNAVQQMFMRLIGADAMLFNWKVKLFAIILLGMVLASPVMKLLHVI